MGLWLLNWNDCSERRQKLGSFLRMHRLGYFLPLTESRTTLASDCHSRCPVLRELVVRRWLIVGSLQIYAKVRVVFTLVVQSVARVREAPFDGRQRETSWPLGHLAQLELFDVMQDKGGARFRIELVEQAIQGAHGKPLRR